MKNIINRLRNKINITTIRDNGSARLTISLRGKPFARKIISTIPENDIEEELH